MVQLDRISDISDKTDEGKMLIAALAVLTSIDHKDIDENKWGGKASVHDVMERINDLANYIYFEEEQKKQMALCNGRAIKLKDLGI